jgi:hypothetical protein
MTIFPGQLAHLKEGKIGSLAKLDTQNPVLYIEYGALGRLKLEGTIVRSKTTRYFTLNVKSRDRLNLEDWFDSCVVFGRYAWVGTVDENPGETPLPFPDALKHVAAATADKNDNGNDKNDESAKKEDEEEPMDPAVAACVAAAKAAYKPPTEADLWTQSVAAEEGAKPIVSRNIADDDDDDDDAPADEPRGAKRIHPDAKRESDDDGVIEVGSDTDDDEARPTQTQGTDAGGRRPRRESAKAVNYAKYDGGDDELFEEEEEEEAGVFRGRATATVAKEAPAGFAAHSLGPGKKEKAPAKPRAPKKEKKKEEEEEEVISIDDDGSDDDEPLAARPAAKGGQKSLLGFLKPGAGGEKPRPKRASVEAAKPVKRKHVLDSDDDEDDEDESEEEDDDDDWA